MTRRPAPPLRANSATGEHAISPGRHENQKRTGETSGGDPEAMEMETDAGQGPFAAAYQRYLASWMASMLVHMILLVTLALIVFSPQLTEPLLEITMHADEKRPELTAASIAPTEIEPTEFKSNDARKDLTVPVDIPPEPTAEPVGVEAEQPTIEPPSINFDHLALNPLRDVSGPYRQGISGGYATRGLPHGSLVSGPEGPNGASQSAVELALNWLARHQNRNGSWSFDHTPGDRCSGFANPGERKSRMGATGLAVLPFLGAGYTPDDGKYKPTVRRAIDYLVRNMRRGADGGRLFEPNGADHEHMYCHGIAACALAEAYGMTQNSKYRAPSQLALNYIVKAQDPNSGGWIYTPRAGGDTSVVGWQIMALKSGLLSRLKVPGRTNTLATKWLDSVQSDLPEDGYGIGSRYGYRRAGDRNGQSGACTAIGLLCRNYLGAAQQDAGLRMGVQWLGERGPSNDDMYYNYYAAMVMFQNDGPKGELWKKWNVRMRDYLVDTQLKEGRDRGSWHFSGNHGNTGGRLYNTALAAMTLEVYYRYLPIYQKENVQDEDFPAE